jgi:hypothetical protein
MGSLSFTAWSFAAAGALCAAGPVIIHLLNRRRYRVVQWAAMDFLRQAIVKNRKILQIRDLVLLALRTLAVLLFGLALARPYFASRQQQFDERQPLHAVIVIDNSLSMAYETLEGSLLDQAKHRARDWIEKLPTGSRTTIIPACGSRDSLSWEPFGTKDDAYEALAKIEIADRTATLAQVANEARRACEDAPELAKRLVWISDQQALNWRGLETKSAFQDLPPIQAVSVAPPQWENTWIADVRVQDGLADVETPTTIVVTIAHRGTSPRRDLQVTLSTGETILGQQTVTVEPGLGAREMSFECVFSGLSELPEPGSPVYLPLRASISPDRLAADDQRFVAVPVVAALPVVFVDQYGPEQEDVLRGRLGETRHLRTLLAPRTSRSDAPRQLVSVRHLTPPELTREALSDARLVVVAGLGEPPESVPLLADYVHQGGQLLIAAGADFDPAAWNAAAWLDGNGILPLPLKAAPIGATPEKAGDTLRPFSLSLESLSGHDIFDLSGVAEGDLKSLYAEPFFFQAAHVDDSPETLEAIKQVEAKRIEQGHNRSPAEPWLIWAGGDRAVEESQPRDSDPQAAARRTESTIARHMPRVLARFELPGSPAFLVSRQLGRGKVLFCSTGMLSSWNTLPKTNAILVFDRALRGMIQNTLPERNLTAIDRLTLALPAAEQNLLVTLTRPNLPTPQPLEVSYVGADRRGVILTGLVERGVYRVAGFRPSTTIDRATETSAWDVSLVVNGSSEESDLSPLTRSDLEELSPGENVHWVAPGDEITLAGTTMHGQSPWWWLVLTVLVLLLAEMAILVWPARPGSQALPPIT